MMVNTVILIVLNALIASAAADTARCREVSAINCDTNYTPDGDERVCCSDLQDYTNLCHFAQKKCKDPTITILNLGPCSLRSSESPTMSGTMETTTVDPPVKSTLTTSDPPLNAESTTSDPPLTQTRATAHHSNTTISKHPNCTDIICSVFCSQAESITCPVDLDPVCGTDGKFYTNDCVFAKAKCKDIDLATQDLVLCKTAGRHRRELAFV